MLDYCRRYWRNHSLRVVLGLGALITTALSRWVEYGTWEADFWLGLSGAFWTTLVINTAARYTWDKDADPTVKPKKRKKK
ncbi:MAG: hypothetical protein ACREO4_09305 [Lysobacter sp.]